MIEPGRLYTLLQPHLDRPARPRGDSGQTIMSFCPAHPDGKKKGNRSLGLNRERGLSCFAGCDFKAILDAMRVDLKDMDDHTAQPIQPLPRPEHQMNLVKTYQYRDTAGKVVAEKGRFEAEDGTKEFKWRLPGIQGWPGIKPMRMEDIPLYGAELLDTIPADEPVYFTEGEKACDACRDAGLPAVTLGGGAGQKAFGTALEPLRGRNVILWPDNDAAGRTYMSRVEASLRDVSAKPRYLSVTWVQREKDDAADYFAGGGTVEAVRESVVTQTVSEIYDRDAVRVKVPTPSGVVHFSFDEISKTRHEFETQVTIHRNGAAPDDEEPYIQRINLLSGTARTNLRRDLEGMYGKSYKWTAVLNSAFAAAQKAFISQDKAVDIAMVPYSRNEDKFHIAPLLPVDAPTIIFGMGSAAKTYMAQSMTLAMACGGSFVGIPALDTRVMYLDYEDDESTFANRMHRIALGAGLPSIPRSSIFYRNAGGVSLPELANTLRTEILELGIEYIFIDSIAAACAGDPEKSDSAQGYFNAVAKLQIGSCHIAHTTKQEESLYPFGSIMWHNRARRTWYISRVDEEDSDTIDVGWYCRKANEGRKSKSFAMSVRFDGDDGPVVMSRSNIQAVPDLAKKTSSHDQVWHILEGRKLNVLEIAQETGLPMKDIDEVFRQDKGKRYTRIENPAGPRFSRKVLV
ncbi:MAG: AAA family ATPase [Chloroflexi bacterium]|nr:AAA family ATPase [Chloroflexota bacterium]